ncbi:hypothetical protein H6G54_00795 [Anabaena cylindrica FACHB-243]|uniref:Uncharacterized protein n=1 Tax=Anabaena cylindrica (strain ATCC 27899 / PCC 7122) TaxID=272123 RepID=K9ZLH2_ANACC|nr:MULTISPECIES: hypothetical protein [Anabaena]AFZ59382.1 hypothetical protein Anacy_4012 [Anabaena cylindrica PCC 7122]MBD2416274.1 hypothetical protein [Anabaena cylindrica FACHB-243]MBY5280236.1 hypothetical protein [Anabaena sp. CCAP 1446/1C]MBY5308508.1 hypothetical protein [Anabaena sp. CCAP 1446/1C]MCM2405300.1 hypothetical protein [Anabaena sp. CCAP 1446/1C]
MLTDFTQYEEVFAGVYTSTKNGCYRVQIPEIFLPIINPTQVLLIGCFSQSASDSWSLAGWVHQIIKLPFKDSYLEEKKCLLGRHNLIIFSTTVDFTLSFKPVRWLDDIQLKVSKYNGSYP